MQGKCAAMKWIAKITSGGRVTIPREVRERLGVRPGDRLSFEVNEAGVWIWAGSVTRGRIISDPKEWFAAMDRQGGDPLLKGGRKQPRAPRRNIFG